MLVRDVAHEARNGGEASAGALAAPVVTVAERREGGHGRWRSRVRQDGSSHARLNGGDACTRKGVRIHEVNCRRGPRNRRREPALVVPHDTWAHSSEQTETTRLGLQ